MQFSKSSMSLMAAALTVLNEVNSQLPLEAAVITPNGVVVESDYARSYVSMYGLDRISMPMRMGQCTDVSVAGYGTYCIRVPVCVGDASRPPMGFGCPDQYTPSVDGQSSYLPVPAQCNRLPSGAWGCTAMYGGQYPNSFGYNQQTYPYWRHLHSASNPAQEISTQNNKPVQEEDPQRVASKGETMQRDDKDLEVGDEEYENPGNLTPENNKSQEVSTPPSKAKQQHTDNFLLEEHQENTPVNTQEQEYQESALETPPESEILEEKNLTPSIPVHQQISEEEEQHTTSPALETSEAENVDGTTKPTLSLGESQVSSSHT